MYRKINCVKGRLSEREKIDYGGKHTSLRNRAMLGDLRGQKISKDLTSAAVLSTELGEYQLLSRIVEGENVKEAEKISIHTIIIYAHTHSSLVVVRVFVMRLGRASSSDKLSTRKMHVSKGNNDSRERKAQPGKETTRALTLSSLSLR